MQAGAIPIGTSVGSSGLISVRNNQQLDEMNRQRFSRAVTKNPDESLTHLSGYLKNYWEKAKQAKRTIENRLVKCKRNVEGEYDAGKLAEIQQMSGSEVFMMITAQKKRDAKAWIMDILRPVGASERLYTLAPTPIPDLPQDIVEELESRVMNVMIQDFIVQSAMEGQEIDPDQLPGIMEGMVAQVKELVQDEVDERALEVIEKMSRKIDDQLVEGKWYKVFKDVVDDFCTYPSAIMKVPVLKRKKKKTYAPDPMTGKIGIVVEKKISVCFGRTSPWDFYPFADAFISDEGYLQGGCVERHRLTRKELQSFIGVPGFKEENIRKVLEEYGKGGLREWLWTDAERATLEGKPSYIPSEKIDALQYFASIPGNLLLDWGMEPDEVPDADMDYEVECWQIGNYVIKAVNTPDKLDRTPYLISSFDKVPGSIWGNALPESIEDTQTMCNAAARAVHNNMGIACLTGDTVVYRHERKGATKQRKHDDHKLVEVTLDELWEQKHKKNSGLRRNCLRSLDESTGEFYGNRVVDIFNNGIRDVFRVTTAKGYSIKATMNHRFMSDDGDYKFLENFSIGDLMAVNGTSLTPRPTCIDCGAGISKKPTAVRCKSCAAKINTWNVKQAREALDNKDASETTARGRKLVRDQMKDSCEECGRTVRLHIHHMDKDPMNCEPSNLKTLCEPCHKQWHVRHDNLGNSLRHVFVDYDAIVSIEPLGKERVFDLQMEAPDHNFVANGFVSHNSGPQVEINTERVDNPDDIWPWKIWEATDDQMGSGAPAVRFYQPSMHAEPLMAIYDRFKKEADHHSGIPAFAHGDTQVGGAGNTSSGLNMLMSAAARGIKAAVSNLDMDIIAEGAERMYDHNMLYDLDESLKGDARVKAGGSAALIAAEQLAVRRGEFLDKTNNDIDMTIIGLNGREYQLREAAKSVELDPDELIKGGGMALQGQPTGQQGKPKVLLPDGSEAGGDKVKIDRNDGGT